MVRFNNVSSASVNFPWNPQFVFGTADMNSSSSSLTSPQDFMFRNNGSELLVVNAAALNYTLVYFNNSVGYNSGIVSNVNYKILYNTGTTSARVVAQTKSYTVLGFQSFLKITSKNDSDFGPSVVPSTQDGLSWVTGLVYDKRNDYLYVSDAHHHRVLVFESGNLTNPIDAIGQNSTYNYKPYNATASTFQDPDKARFDCSNSLWVTDSSWRRLLRFPSKGQFVGKVADIVWGQSSFSTTELRQTQTGFDQPTDIVFSNDCSVAFVADNNRVLRFTAPFNPYQAAEGVLGASNFGGVTCGPVSNSTFCNIGKLELIDYGNGTGLLYILDTGFNRILAGTTQWNVSAPGSLDNCNTSSTVCFIYHPTNFSSSTVRFNYTLIVVYSTISFDNSSELIIGSDQQIETSGDIYLSGNLTVVLTQEANDQLTNNQTILIPILSSNSSILGFILKYQHYKYSNRMWSHCCTENQRK